MRRSVATSRVARRARLDVFLALTVATLGVGTAALLLFPQIRGHVVAPAVDLVLDTVALVVTASVAILLWARYRERRQTIAVFQSAAFLVLAVADATAIFLAISKDLIAVAPPAELGEAQLLVWTVARMVAAVLLVVGGVAALRGDRP